MVQRKESFIVNLWSERDAGGDAERTGCRGSVEHVQTRRRLYFTELVELAEFLTRYTFSDGGAT